jgi:gliding motility-associated-like protein
VNNSGCTAEQTFEIKTSTVDWNVTFDGTTKLCPSESGTLTVAVTNNTENAVVTYTFTLPNASVVVSTNNVLPITQIGTYTVVADILGCKSTPVNFTVDASIADWKVSFIDEPYEICTGESVTLSFNTVNFNIDNPNATYKWTSPTGVTGTGKTFTTSEVGTHLLAVNIFGCISTFNVQVTANTLAIEIEFTQGCENNAYKLVAEPFNGSFDVATSSFSWSGPGLVLTDEPNTIILKANGDYTVTVTNAQGCSSSKTVSVNNTSCTIQRGISPNNDGDNDSFDLSALNVKELSIFNRYGTAVYNYGTYTDQWKGQSNTGAELPDGTYFYVIQTAAGESITGWIFINR